MTIERAISNEIKKLYSDVEVYYVDAKVCAKAPYLVITQVVSIPDYPCGETSRYQLTMVHNDKQSLDERMKAIKAAFHNKVGDIGGLIISDSQCVQENPITPRNAAGEYCKSIDLRFYITK